MSPKIRLQLTLLVVCLLANPACKKQQAQTAAGGPPPVPVTVATVTTESIPFELRVVGSAAASSVVQVKSQVTGQLVKVHLTEGQDVVKDSILFEIDPRPYQEALKQAEAGLARNRALLRQAEANLARGLAEAKNAEANAQRYAALTKEGVISREQNEQVRTTADVQREAVRAAEAAIESARAAIQSDLAAIDKAKLDLSYCQIRAPLSGRAGNLLVYPGNLVSANAGTPLVVIHQVSPLFVTFSVPEMHLPAIRRLHARAPLPVFALQANSTGNRIAGRLTVIDNTVDPTTGTISLKAVFDNKDRLLWPGQFVNVVLHLETLQNVTVVPSEAVQVGQKGQYVYVVKADKTVEPRIVTPGRSHENKTIIETGLAPGEQVVTDGHLRLAPGFRIQVVAPVPPVGVERT